MSAQLSATPLLVMVKMWTAIPAHHLEAPLRTSGSIGPNHTATLDVYLSDLFL